MMQHVISLTDEEPQRQVIERPTEVSSFSKAKNQRSYIVIVFKSGNVYDYHANMQQLKFSP